VVLFKKLLFPFFILVFVVSALFVLKFNLDLESVTENALLSARQVISIGSREIVQSEPVEILFVGDVMLSRQVGKVMEREQNYKYPFLRVASILQEADIVFGNLEGPISSRGYDAGSEYSFRGDPRVVEGLSFAGFDVMSLANNHIWDWGAEAIDDTISILSDNGIATVGAGNDFNEANSPSIIDLDDTSVGFLSYTTLYPEGLKATKEGAGVSNIDLALQKVAELAENVDVVIVSLHWGEEYELLSNESQQKLSRSLIDVGADIIVGHHPHVTQEVERYKNGWILYSLGNFVFDQTFSEDTRTGMVAQATINGDVIELSTKRIYISETFQPVFVSL